MEAQGSKSECSQKARWKHTAFYALASEVTLLPTVLLGEDCLGSSGESRIPLDRKKAKEFLSYFNTFIDGGAHASLTHMLLVRM